MVNRFARSTGNADANQSQITSALLKIGAKVHDMERPVDLLIEFRSIWIVLEVKTQKGTLTPAQERFFEKTKAPAFIVHDAEEAVAAVVTAWKRTKEKN